MQTTIFIQANGYLCLLEDLKDETITPILGILNILSLIIPDQPATKIRSGF